MSEDVTDSQNQSNPWKKLIGLAVLLCLIAVGGFVWLAMPPREPSYHGKPLGYWLKRYEESPFAVNDKEKDPTYLECLNAVRHIGTNALPFLLRTLRAKDSRLKTQVIDLLNQQNYFRVSISSVEERKTTAGYGFLLLGELASNAVPALIEIHSHPATEGSKEIADKALMELYPAPCVVNPYWLPPDEWENWFATTGKTQAGLEAPSNAALAFTRVIDLNPTNEDAYFDRGDARMDAEDYAGALTDLNRFLASSPSNETAVYYRGACKYNLKDYPGADVDLTAAINLNSNASYYWSYRGIVRLSLRRLEEALADCTKSIELGPGDGTAYSDRALVESVLLDYEAALADASKAIELDEKDGDFYYSRAEVQNGLRNYSAALLDNNRALELEPKDSSVWTSRAATSVYLDDFAGAAADLKQAFQLNPTNEYAFLVRAFMKLKRGGEDDSALADAERAVELSLQWPEYIAVLGPMQYKLARWEDALASCRRALKLGALEGRDDCYGCIWLIQAQSGKEAAADEELNGNLKSMVGAKTNEWAAIVARFLTGAVPERDFLELAKTSARHPGLVKSQACDSLYYAGMKRKLAGDRAGAASLFQRCIEAKDDNTFAYMNAVLEIRKLKGTSAAVEGGAAR